MGEHCECDDLACPKECYKKCHPPADCDCFIKLFNLTTEEDCPLRVPEDNSVGEVFVSKAATPPPPPKVPEDSEGVVLGSKTVEGDVGAIPVQEESVRVEVSL